LEKTSEISDRLREHLKDSIVEMKNPRERRIFLRVKKEAFRETLEYVVNDLGFKHLSAITGVDLGTEIELLYHVVLNDAVVLTLGFSVPKEKSTTRTITDLVPSAVLYEREVHELLGVGFEGHPNLIPLVLPEGWPQDVYPLRKEWQLEQLRKIALEK
jgi:NADH:ubiquinone oxidoreductase subunit C